MALYNDLNEVLNNIAFNVAPVIKLPNGLYTLVDKNSIIPSYELGTRLLGHIIDYSLSENDTYNIELLGYWNTYIYYYDNSINKWIFSNNPV